MSRSVRVVVVSCAASMIWMMSPPMTGAQAGPTHGQEQTAQAGPSDGQEQAAPPTFRNVRELVEAWREYAVPLGSLPREERVEIGLAFFEKLPWSTLLEWCRDGSPAVASEEDESFLEGLTDSKLRWRAPGADTLAAIVRDPGLSARCQAAVVKYISKNRAAYAGKPEGEMLARAFVDLADSKTRETGINFGLERGAVCLAATEELMKRMMTHCHSGDASRVEQGVIMLGMSLDERAGDSLLVVTRALAGTGAHPSTLGTALQTLAKRVGPGAFSTIADVYESAPDTTLRRSALLALSWTDDERLFPVLIAAYADSATGIVDSTHAIPGMRNHYWDLWLMTRIAEKTLTRSLKAGTPGAPLAAELVDRESRFGPPADLPEMHAALEAWSSREPGAAARAAAISSRFDSYPDYRPQPKGENGF